jgi:hypothetical protein
LEIVTHCARLHCLLRDSEETSVGVRASRWSDGRVGDRIERVFMFDPISEKREPWASGDDAGRPKPAGTVPGSCDRNHEQNLIR